MESPSIQNSTHTPTWLRFIVGRRPMMTLLRISVLVLLSFLAFRFWLIPIRVTGNSMLPSYKNGAINFINKLAYRRQHPQR
ncbi:MAG: S26 family signal peptidase, partial [Verrucomicrobia bacterium]|nr:S26 family signal peptidase [Verrucomicrobiota bacterium]